MTPKIGVALAVYNSRDITWQCLTALTRSSYRIHKIAVVDHGSSDGTSEMIRDEFPNVHLVITNGDLWWAGATNVATRVILNSDCDYIMLLNPDSLVEKTTVGNLVDGSLALNGSCVSPIVVQYSNPSLVWEAGHSLQPIPSVFPLLWLARYQWKPGTQVSKIPREPFPTISITGRGSLVPRKIFDTIGLFNETKLPHYGADTDFALRAWRAGFHSYIVPNAKILLHTEHTGMSLPVSARNLAQDYFKYLFSRKHGSALSSTYNLYMNNFPVHSAVPTVIFHLTLNTIRFFQKSLFPSRRNRP